MLAVQDSLPQASGLALPNVACAHHARARIAVLRAAIALDDDHARVLQWYGDEAIAELDGLTADELVRRGQGARVLELLRSIHVGERDECR